MSSVKRSDICYFARAYRCNELRFLLLNHVVIIRSLCMTSLMVTTCIYSVYWTSLVSCHMVVLSVVLNFKCYY